MVIAPALSTWRIASAAPIPPAELPIIMYFVFFVLAMLSPPTCFSLQGQLHKIVIKLEPYVTALFRMKLGRYQVPSGNDTAQAKAVFRLTSHQRLILRLHVIAVYKVEVGFVRYTIEDRVGNYLLNLVPPHVWNLEARRKTAHLPRNHAEALMPAAFFGAGKKNLQPDADA
jgi:hypothetical protein